MGEEADYQLEREMDWFDEAYGVGFGYATQQRYPLQPKAKFDMDRYVDEQLKHTEEVMATAEQNMLNRLGIKK